VDGSNLVRALSEECLALLPKVIGRRVTAAYTPSLHIELGTLTKFKASSFSLSLSDQNEFFSIFQSEWLDSKVCAIDCFQLEVSLQNYPRGLEAQYSGKSISEPYGIIEFKNRFPAEPTWPVIKKIALYEKLDSDSTTDNSVTETSRYDEGLMFECNDGYRFGVWIDDTTGIAGWMAFSDNADLLDELFSAREPKKIFT